MNYLVAKLYDNTKKSFLILTFDIFFITVHVYSPRAGEINLDSGLNSGSNRELVTCYCYNFREISSSCLEV